MSSLCRHNIIRKTAITNNPNRVCFVCQMYKNLPEIKTGLLPKEIHQLQNLQGQHVLPQVFRRQKKKDLNYEIVLVLSSFTVFSFICLFLLALDNYFEK